MALKLSLDSLDGLDEAIAKEYVLNEEKGKYYLEWEGADGLAVDNVQQLKKDLAEAKTKQEKATSLLEDLKDIDPKQARDALKKIEEMKTWTPADQVKNRLEAERKALEDKWSGDLKREQDEKQKLATQLQKAVVTQAAIAEIARLKGNQELLLPVIERAARAEPDEHGNYVPRILDENGNARISMKQGNTDKMDLKEFVESLRKNDTYSVCFEGAGASGAGTKGDGRATGDGGKSVRWGDSEALSANLDAIADGTMSVVD